MLITTALVRFKGGLIVAAIARQHITTNNNRLTYKLQAHVVYSFRYSVSFISVLNYSTQRDEGKVSPKASEIRS